MFKDQLTRPERIRLECLNQSNIFNQMKNLSDLDIIKIAKTFEEFILNAKDGVN